MNKLNNELKPEKTLARTIGEAGLFFSISNFIVKIASLASALILIRSLSIYDYGLWQLILSVVGIFGIFTLPGSESFVLADLSLELGKKKLAYYKTLFKQYSTTIFVLSLLAAIIIFASSPLISSISNKNITLYLRIVAFFLLADGVKRFYRLFWHTNLKFFQLNLLESLDRTLYLVLIIIFLIFLKLGLTGASLAYVLASLSTVLILAPLILRDMLFLKNIKIEDRHIFWQNIKRHGKWSLVNDYFDDLIVNSRPWVIGYFLGVENLAIFSVAKNLLSQLNSLLPINQILAPIIPRHIIDKERFRLFFIRSIKYALWFSIVVGVVAFLLMPSFLKIFFPKYLTSLPLFNILLLSFIVITVSAVVMQVYYTLKAQKILFFSTPLKLISVIILLPLLIKLFNLKGVALEYVILAYMLFFLRYYLLIRREAMLRIDFRSLIQFDQFDKVLVSKIINKFVT